MTSNQPTPGWGTCRNCGDSWDHVPGHETQYNERYGCFTLCEECWKQLCPVARLPYYRKMYENWLTLGDVKPGTWEQIRSAVLAGG